MRAVRVARSLVDRVHVGLLAVEMPATFLRGVCRLVGQGRRHLRRVIVLTARPRLVARSLSSGLVGNVAIARRRRGSPHAGGEHWRSCPPIVAEWRFMFWSSLLFFFSSTPGWSRGNR